MKNKLTIIIILTTILTTAFTCKSPNEPEDKSSVADTTSQNFEFTVKEFGDGGASSYLNDVWIFDNNNIWAVGYIGGDNKLNDGCFLKWNGSKWNLINRDESYPVFNSSGFTGIWAIDSNNIYLTAGIVGIYKYGKFNWMDFSNITFSSGQGVYKLWGNSENNIWGVGPKGTVVHFNGTSWKKVPCNINLDIQYINGDSETGEAFSTAYDSEKFDDALLIFHTQDSVWVETVNLSDEIHVSSFGEAVPIGNNHLMISSYQVKIYDLKTRGLINYSIPSDVMFSGEFISWLAGNDFYQWGYSIPDEKVAILHYNGSSYQVYKPDIINSFKLGDCYAVKDLAVFTGFANNKGYVITMKRKK